MVSYQSIQYRSKGTAVHISVMCTAVHYNTHYTDQSIQNRLQVSVHCATDKGKQRQARLLFSPCALHYSASLYSAHWTIQFSAHSTQLTVHCSASPLGRLCELHLRVLWTATTQWLHVNWRPRYKEQYREAQAMATQCRTMYSAHCTVHSRYVETVGGEAKAALFSHCVAHCFINTA